MSDRIVVVAGLIARGGWLLISQRPESSGFAGLWEFPGGKVEPGESDREALRRELQEELAIDVEVGSLAWTTRTERFDLRFMRCGFPYWSRPRPLACTQFRWVRIPELAGYAFPPADDAVIAALTSGRIAGVGR